MKLPRLPWIQFQIERLSQNWNAPLLRNKQQNWTKYFTQSSSFSIQKYRLVPSQRTSSHSSYKSSSPEWARSHAKPAIEKASFEFEHPKCSCIKIAISNLHNAAFASGIQIIIPQEMDSQKVRSRVHNTPERHLDRVRANIHDVIAVLLTSRASSLHFGWPQPADSRSLRSPAP